MNQLTTSIFELIEDESLSATRKQADKKIKIEIENTLSDEFQVLGDPHLLRRLLRNAIENACSFAQNLVNIKLRLVAEQIEIVIEDDGPGFSSEVLKSFGERP